MLGVLGDLVEDIVVWLAEPLRAATDTDMSMHRTRGGSAANVAAFAGGQYPTRFLGCVGDDAVGASLVADLQACGVDVRVQQRGTTGAVIVLVDPDGERTMLPNQGASGLLEPVDPAWLDGLEHLHVTAYSLAAEPVGSSALAAARYVTGAGGTVSVDASSTGLLRRYGAERFVGLLTELAPRFLFANRSEAAFLDVAHDGEPGHALAGLPHTVAVVKDGDRPTTVLAPGEPPVRVDVPPVGEVRDLTGAGDAFAAGFLARWAEDRADLPAACAAGHATAARVLRSPGASPT